MKQKKSKLNPYGNCFRSIIFLCLLLLPSPIFAQAISVRLGENKTITTMNWHETRSEVPAPSNPGTLAPDTMEYTSNGNTAHALVGTSATNQPQCADAESGNAYATIGADIIIEGAAGGTAIAEITMNYAYDGSVALDGGGTSHAILHSDFFPTVHDEIKCTTFDQPPPILCTNSFSGSANKSKKVIVPLRAGENKKIGLALYAHSDTCGISGQSYINATISSIVVNFMPSQPFPYFIIGDWVFDPAHSIWTGQSTAGFTGMAAIRNDNTITSFLYKDGVFDSYATYIALLSGNTLTFVTTDSSDSGKIGQTQKWTVAMSNNNNTFTLTDDVGQVNTFNRYTLPPGGNSSQFTPHSTGSTWTYIVTPNSGGSCTFTKTVQQSTITDCLFKFDASNSLDYELGVFNDSSGQRQSVDAYFKKADNSFDFGYTYSPAALFVASNMTPGITAKSVSTRTDINTNATGTFTRDIIVNAIESVSVPAGTFTAVKTTTTISWMPASGTPNQTTDTRWYVPGFGWVKRILYPTATPSNTTTYALSSYSSVPINVAVYWTWSEKQLTVISGSCAAIGEVATNSMMITQNGDQLAFTPINNNDVISSSITGTIYGNIITAAGTVQMNNGSSLQVSMSVTASTDGRSLTGTLSQTSADTNFCTGTFEISAVAENVTVPVQTGSKVISVTLMSGQSVTTTFTTVIAPGTLTVTPIPTPASPVNFSFVGGTSYEITSTAGYSGPITVCIGYDPAKISVAESALRLFHLNGIVWEDITLLPVDVANHRVCGVTNSLSPFVIGYIQVCKPGDCDCNGNVSIAEVQSAINMYLGLKPVALCVDADGNDSVSIAEVQKVINGYLGL